MLLTLYYKVFSPSPPPAPPPHIQGMVASARNTAAAPKFFFFKGEKRVDYEKPYIRDKREGFNPRLHDKRVFWFDKPVVTKVSPPLMVRKF